MIERTSIRDTETFQFLYDSPNEKLRQILDELLEDERAVDDIKLAPGLNSPLDLMQHDRNGCVSCMTANAGHILGVQANQIDPWQIDSDIGREAGKPIKVYKGYSWLLSRGVSIHQIEPLEELEYTRDKLAEENSPSDLKRYSSEARLPIFKDVTDALLQQSIVLMYVPGSSENIYHPLLAFGFNDERIGVYEPQLANHVPRLQAPKFETVVQRWNAADGIAILNK